VRAARARANDRSNVEQRPNARAASNDIRIQSFGAAPAVRKAPEQRAGAAMKRAMSKVTDDQPTPVGTPAN
jgi:hypothetical protein